MGKASVPERTVGEKPAELAPAELHRLTHKQRQFKGFCWFNDYHERHDKAWLMDGQEEPMGLDFGIMKFITALKKIGGAKCL